ncbi:TraR/DksA family transcriptional regulator [Treponema brennaborense]|uniref:Transcriptional regulator, TraR/DksA family n=1 Tax=Treponema brennaborense (strain DSM 12168 / CIP 105900 / DD5/3) TaxID=906968 RepID=F4LK42_TREBD|nr:TraR/DksA family transcriptional regulator [Treponema brennaborense]AEE17504.1 transcriptional regulator, TraR/DksA family [Treponema brennaborense DSM 12168]
MEKEFVSEMKEKLLEQKKEIIDSLLENNADFRQLVEGGEARDCIDEASDVVDRKMLEALGTKDTNRLNAINAALSRIELGKYGLCMKCGKPIPEARLRAIPFAMLCIDCKAADERRNR